MTREVDSGPPKPIYSRDGLEASEHALQQSLAPRTTYLWSVRARFELDGRLHWTEWSGLDRVHWFRFTTP